MFLVDSSAIIVPAGLLYTGQGLACARAVNMRAVSAPAFTNNMVITELAFFLQKLF